MLSNQGYGINSDADDERLVPDWAGQKRGGMLQKTMKAIGKVKISGKSKKKQAPMELMNSDSSMQYKHPYQGDEAADSDGEHTGKTDEGDDIDDAIDSDQPAAVVDSDKGIDGGSEVSDGGDAEEDENGAQETLGNVNVDDGEANNEDVFSSPVSRRMLVEDLVVDNAKKEPATPKTAAASIAADGAMQFDPSVSSQQSSMPKPPSAHTPGQWKKRSLIPKMKGMKGLGSVIKMKNGIERNKKKSMQLMESVASMDYHVDEFQVRDEDNAMPVSKNHLKHEDSEVNDEIPCNERAMTNMATFDENADAPMSSRSLVRLSPNAGTFDKDVTPETPIVEKDIISGVMQFDPSGIATERSFLQTPMASADSIINSVKKDSPSSSASPGATKGRGQVSSEGTISSQSGQGVATKADQPDGNGDETLGRLSETIKTFGSGTAFDGYFSKIKDRKQQVDPAHDVPRASKEGSSDQANGKSSVLLTLTGSQDVPLSTTIQLELDEGMKLNSLVASKVEKSQITGEKGTADSLFKSPMKPSSKTLRRSKHSGSKEPRKSKEGLQAGDPNETSSKELTTQQMSMIEKKSGPSRSNGSSDAHQNAKLSSSAATPTHQDGTVSWNRVNTSKAHRTSGGKETATSSSGHSPKSRKSSTHASDSPSRRVKRPTLSGRKKSTGTDDDKGGVSWKRIESSKSHRNSAGQRQQDNSQTGATSPSRASKRNTISGHATSNRSRRKKQPTEELSLDKTSEALDLAVPGISPSLVGQPSTSLREIRRLVEASKGDNEDLGTFPLDSIPQETPSTPSSQPRTPSNRRTSRRLQRIAARTETSGPSPSPRVNMVRALSLRNFRYDKETPGSSPSANPTPQRRGTRRPSEATTGKEVTGAHNNDRSSRDKKHGEPSEDPSWNHRHRRSRNLSDVGASNNGRQRSRKSSESSATPVAPTRRIFTRSESLKHFGRPNDAKGPAMSDLFGGYDVVDGPVGEASQVDANDSVVQSQSQNSNEETNDASGEGDVSATPSVSRRAKPSYKRNSRIIPENKGEIRSMDSPSGSRSSLRRQKARRKHSELSELKSEEETGNRVSQTSVGDSQEIANAGAPKEAAVGSIPTQSTSTQPQTTEGEHMESRKNPNKHSVKKKDRQQLPDSEAKVEKSEEDNMDEERTKGKVLTKSDSTGESSTCEEKTDAAQVEQVEKTATPEIEHGTEEVTQVPPSVENTNAVDLQEQPREFLQPAKVDALRESTVLPPTKAKAKPKRGPPRLSATLQLGALRKGHQHMDDQSVFSDAFGSVVGDGPGFKPDKHFPEIHTAEELCAPQLVFNPKKNQEGMDVQVSINEVGPDLKILSRPTDTY